jgi:hypothetical protein
MTPPPPPAAVATAPAPAVRPRRRPPAPARPRRVSGPARSRPAPARRAAPSRNPAAIVTTHPLFDRLIHGRAWIGLVAFALIGIVTMQLGLLKLNAGIGRALEHEAALQRENSALSVENSEVAAGDTVELQAAHMGMQLVPAGALKFLAASPAYVDRAASALNRPVSPPPSTESESSGESSESAEGSAASSESTASSASSESSESSETASETKPEATSSAAPAEATESTSTPTPTTGESAPTGESGGASATPGG